MKIFEASALAESFCASPSRGFSRYDVDRTYQIDSGVSAVQSEIVEHALLQLLAGRRGHFQMESGYHSEQWFDLACLLVQRDRLRPFISELGKRLMVHRPAAVCGPMTGGAKLAEIIAGELSIDYLFTERFAPADATGFFPVQYKLPPELRRRAQGRPVAIVDDAISAGSALRGTYSDLIACGARPVALGALFVFGDAAARFANEKGVMLESIAKMKFDLWKPNECPLCARRVPVEKVSDADDAPG